ncbi:DCD domain-containing protein NRP-like isoform X3 [Zingiber officinale]|uniref:DCD domain-containing protein NRP-like isoform X3 n=1 Tax=Zingiber officinale TaxID=94328 RepID=UPI001C4D9A06|nr:DCD domain-containing protein NRP-like isoform X3 [Zingiber officinale]
MDSLWKLGDEFRGQTKNLEDYQWSVMTSKLAELTKSKVGRQNNLEYSKNSIEAKPYDKVEFHEDNKLESINLGLVNLDLKINDTSVKSLFHGAYSMSNAYQKSNTNEINSFKLDYAINKYAKNSANREVNHNTNDSNSYDNINGNNNSNNIDKRFKTLPSTEMLPRNEVLGGYIFVCNNDTMQEDLKRQLFDAFMYYPSESFMSAKVTKCFRIASQIPRLSTCHYSRIASFSIQLYHSPITRDI